MLSRGHEKPARRRGMISGSPNTAAQITDGFAMEHHSAPLHEGRRLTDRYTHAMRADGRASDITLRHNNAAGGQHGFNRHKTDADDIVQALGVTGRRTTHTTNSAVPTWSVVA